MNDIWIALANVEKRPGFEHILGSGGGYGAFLGIIVKAHNTKELKRLAKRVFFEEGFVLIEIKNAELLSERLKRTTIDQDLLDLVNIVSKKNPVQFGTFHTYPEKDEIKDDTGTTT